MRTFALLNIPERCALVGGQILVRSQQLLGITTTAIIGTEYEKVWQKSITVGKAYFIPMMIAPQGGITLYLTIYSEPIETSKDTEGIIGLLPDITPKIMFSGRLMVPEEEHLDWRKVQVQPVEIEEVPK